MPLTKDPNIPPQPGSRQGALIGLQIFFIIVALLVYGLRVYTRRFILRSVGNDDYIMGIAVVWLPFSRQTQLGQSSSLSSLLRIAIASNLSFYHMCPTSPNSTESIDVVAIKHSFPLAPAKSRFSSYPEPHFFSHHLFISP
jgi:hypothetical protein